MKSLCLMMLLVFGLDSVALAYDIAVPGGGRRPLPRPVDPSGNQPNEPKPEEQVPKEKKELERLVIRVDADAKEAKLIIPTSILRSLQSDSDKSSFVSPRNVIDGQPILGRIGTIVGGMLLALSILFGGLWLMRNRKMSANNLAAIFVIVSLSGIGTTSLVFANSAPPPEEARSLTGKIFSKAVHSHKFASGELRVETSDKGDSILLIVPDSK
jgi:hypothetical protein